jgi:hypothetical protein
MEGNTALNIRQREFIHIDMEACLTAASLTASTSSRRIWGRPLEPLAVGRFPGIDSATEAKMILRHSHQS